MDVIKVFTEEPIGLEALVADADPDARRLSANAQTLDALLAGPSGAYARAYLAGTRLGDPRRVGLTAVDDAEAFVQPLLAWASGRDWAALAADGTTRGLTPPEAATALRRPDRLRALAVGVVPLGALAEAAGAGTATAVASRRREHLPALRALLDAGVSVLFPEPAFDGHDWNLFSTAPLRDGLVAAFRAHPTPDAVRFVAPYRRARGEHTFYIEQWALENLPDWAERV